MKLILFFFVITISLNAQQNNTQAVLYNIGLGGITSSVGAVFNKKHNEKLGKVVLKAFWKGILGGSIIYGSKKMVYSYHNSNRLDKLWQAKLVNSIGVSIIENAALNNKVYNKWHINIGFNRIEFDIIDKKINYKIMPAALIGTIISSTKSTFNLKYSIQTLTPVFIADNINRAITNINSIKIVKHISVNRYLAHEFIHVLQYDDYMSVNVFFNNRKNIWLQKNKFRNQFNKWVFIDMPSAAILRGSYLIENIHQNCYFNNYFEHEANYYSNQYDCSVIQR